MANEYNEVHVLNEEHKDHIKIFPEHLYLTIPANWVCTYHKLLIYMADFGKRIVDDCNSMCKGNSKNIVTCWNLFQSAVACHNLGRNKEADFFIDYINKQLENVYKGTDKIVYNNTVPLNITEDGKLKAIASCDNEINFYVDAETGKLYQKYIEDKNNSKVYAINDDDLIATDNGVEDSD